MHHVLPNLCVPVWYPRVPQAHPLKLQAGRCRILEGAQSRTSWYVALHQFQSYRDVRGAAQPQKELPDPLHRDLRFYLLLLELVRFYIETWTNLIIMLKYVDC